VSGRQASGNTTFAVVLASVVLAAIVANSLIIRMDLGDNPGNDVRALTQLTYCSDATSVSCQGSIARVQIDFQLRTEWARERQGYPAPTEFRVKLSDLRLRLEKPVEEAFSGHLVIHRDSDMNGVYSSEDALLATATVKGKSVRFEDLDILLSGDELDLDTEKVLRVFLFITNDANQAWSDVEEVTPEGEVELIPLVKDVDIKAFNLGRGGRDISNESVFVDKSVFDAVEAAHADTPTFLNSYGFFELGSHAQQVVLKADTYEITNDVVIPHGVEVVVEPGVRLMMGPGVSLVSYSPFDLKGTQQAPIEIRNLVDGENFGSFAIIGEIGKEASVVVENVFVSNGGGTKINGARITGMFSIYRIPEVVLRDSTFANSASDDGLNIKYANVNLEGNTFLNNSADGWDGDFVTGSAVGNLFAGNGNDALDFSGSDIRITHNHVDVSGDKCVSVGEKSTVVLEYNILAGCEIGVQVKDGSDLNMRRNIVIDPVQFALDAYVKKNFFGEPSATYFDNVFIADVPVAGLIDPDMLVDNVSAEDALNISEAPSWYAELNASVDVDGFVCAVGAGKCG